MKRKRLCADVEGPPQSIKRSRKAKVQLLNFTDEVLLRILSFIDVRDLNCLEAVSSRVQRLCNDNSLWRAKFSERWLQRRVLRHSLWRNKDHQPSLSHLNPAHRSFLLPLDPTQSIDWKRAYRIRSNWVRGRCKKVEVQHDKLPAPTQLCCIQQGIVFTADTTSGLTARLRTGSLKSLHRHPLSAAERNRTPTSIASSADCSRSFLLGVGFSDGSLEIFTFDVKTGFTSKSRHLCSLKPTTSVAIVPGYVLTVHDGRLMSLYQLHNDCTTSCLCQPLTALQAEQDIEPISVSLRKAETHLIAGLAYPIARLGLGWSVGVQEIHLRLPNKSSDIPGTQCPAKGLATIETMTRYAFSAPLVMHPKVMQCPSALSYSHPYLVATLSDNTMMAYLVRSTSDRLEILAGQRLWGHTSAISGVMVDSRGKTITVSMRGDDVRIWDLEETQRSHSGSSIKIRPRSGLDQLSVAIAQRGSGLGSAVRSLDDESLIKTCWVGFDAEQVLIAGERDQTPLLTCYDFDLT